MPEYTLHISAYGAAAAVLIAGLIAATLWWMLHPPASSVQKLAAEAESELKEMVGSIIIAFSKEIDSAHMMALAVKLAHGERSDLHAIYVIEVPYTLPPDAEMAVEERAALDALGAAEALALKADVTLRTDTIKARSTKQAVLDVAKTDKANLIILGSYREGKYMGAPLGHALEEIATDAKCDVLIGVEGKHGALLGESTPGKG